MNKTARTGHLPAFLLCLSIFVLASCVSTPAKTIPASGPLNAETAMNKLVQDLLVTLPSPLRLGIDDFYLGNARKTALGRYLGQYFLTALVNQGGGSITPVERQRLDAALAESNYNLGQLVQDPGKFSQVGAFLPAQAIATATMTALSDRVTVNLRVFSVATGEVIGAASVSIIRTADIDSMIPPVL